MLAGTDSLINEINSQPLEITQSSSVDQMLADTNNLIEQTNSEFLQPTQSDSVNQLLAETNSVIDQTNSELAKLPEPSEPENPALSFTRSVDNDVSAILDPSTSEAELAKIDARAAHQINTLEGLNAGEEIRNSVRQNELEMQWSNTAHEAQINQDSAEIAADGHSRAAQNYAAQGDAAASAAEAESAATANEQANNYKGIVDLYSNDQ